MNISFSLVLLLNLIFFDGFFFFFCLKDQKLAVNMSALCVGMRLYSS